MKSSVRLAILAFSLCGPFLLFLFLYCLNETTIELLGGLHIDNDGQEIGKSLLLENLFVRMYMQHGQISDSRTLETHSTNYDSLFSKHSINSVVGELDFSQRCDLYFTNLFVDDSSWIVDPNERLPLYERELPSFEVFVAKYEWKIKQSIAVQKHCPIADLAYEDFTTAAHTMHQRLWNATIGVEQKIVNTLSHVRIFNKCYITSDNLDESTSSRTFIDKQKKFYTMLKLKNLLEKTVGNLESFEQTKEEETFRSAEQFSNCNSLESKIYPWLSGKYPKYERWSNEVSAGPPILRDYGIQTGNSNPEFKDGKGKGEKMKSFFTLQNKDCFLPSFKNQLNGQGIVLTVGYDHVADTVRLLYLLRALNNKLPIQIILRSDFREVDKQELRIAAREPFTTLPESFHNVRKYFPKDYFNDIEGLRKQEIWFVDVDPAINPVFVQKFTSYGNKFLAAMFNSFEEYMLIDSDTVVVQNPEFFFELKQFTSKGAFFYRDRTASSVRPKSDAKFFKKLTPSPLDQIMFNIPVILPKGFETEFFDGLYHYMESGLVMINRNMHFNSILMMIQMNFLQTVTDRVWGDKEIFFLAFLASGEENFHFNELPAAAIGVVSPQDERFSNDNIHPLSREICSAHPAHINGEDGKSLVWFNSGFQMCGKSHKVTYKDELEKGTRFKAFKTEEEIETLYNNRMSIKNAIIPPFTSKSNMISSNNAGEKSDGWKIETYCSGYLWCAYDRLGGQTDDGDNTQVGKFIEFDQKSIDLFAYYGDIWINSE